MQDCSNVCTRTHIRETGKTYSNTQVSRSHSETSAFSQAADHITTDIGAIKIDYCYRRCLTD